MTIPDKGYELITTTEDLKSFCDHAREACHNGDFVTFDTEFIREKTYFPHLCLIQAATNEQAVIIDPLAKDKNDNPLDLSPLFPILKDPDCQIVIHAGRQDLEILNNLMGELPTAIFDTQIAAMVCGFGDSVGYETLVKTICKQGIDKTSRFSNWAQRPLTQKQLDYAITDVTHLRDVFKHIHSSLVERDRMSWTEEESRVLLDPKSYDVDFRKLLHKLKLRTNKPHILARALYLLKWRETTAEAENKPRQHMMRDDLIAELAVQNPTSKEDFRKIRGMRDRLLKHTVTMEILDVLKTASNLPAEDCPALPKPENLERVDSLAQDALRLILTYISVKEDVAEKIIASAKDLSALIRYREKASIPCMTGWRKECFGELALAFLDGKLSIDYDESGLRLRETNL